MEVKNWLLKTHFTDHRDEIDALLNAGLEDFVLISTGIHLIMDAIKYPHYEDKNIANLILFLKNQKPLQDMIIEMSFKEHCWIVKTALKEEQASSATIELLLQTFRPGRGPLVDGMLWDAQNMPTFKKALLNTYYASDGEYC